MHLVRIIAATFTLAVLASPVALAGTLDAPELSDAAGDASGCYGPVGNEYGDVVAAWISDETKTTFNVNLALNKWEEHAAGFTGYTVQFTHQGVQFGAIAAYIPAPMGAGWEYDNGFVDTETGELRDFTDATGSFTPGTPAVLTIEFSKSHFPHADMSDNRLVEFKAGSADFKNGMTNFADPTGAVPEQKFFICDTALGTSAYEFQVGGHSMDMPNDTAPNGNVTVDTNGGSSNDTPNSGGVTTAAANDTNDTPGAGLLLVVIAAIGAVALRRRS